MQCSAQLCNCYSSYFKPKLFASMKKKMIFSLVIVCTMGLFSCTKSMLHSENDNSNELVAGTVSTSSHVSGSTFFDPGGLISASQHGVLDTIQKGFGFTEGPAVDKDGNLIACADMHGELWRIAPDGSHTVLVNNYNGKLLNGPNDVWINPK